MRSNPGSTSRARQQRLENLLISAYRDLPAPNHLDTIPGFGEVTAAVLTASSHGDVIDLWAALHKMSVRAAALDLTRTFDLEPAPTTEKRNGWPE
jgi:hypothetical protein